MFFFIDEFEGEMKGYKYNGGGRELEALFQVFKRKKKLLKKPTSHVDTGTV